MKNLISAHITIFLLAVLFMVGRAEAQEYEPAITDTGVVRLVDVMDVYKCENGTTTATCAAISFHLCFAFNEKDHCDRIGVPYWAEFPKKQHQDRKDFIFFRITSMVTHPEAQKINSANPLQAVYMFVQVGELKGNGSEKPLPGKVVYSDKDFRYDAVWFVFRPSNGILKLVVWDTFYVEGGCDDEDDPMCAFNGAPSRVFDEIRSKP